LLSRLDALRTHGGATGPAHEPAREGNDLQAPGYPFRASKDVRIAAPCVAALFAAVVVHHFVTPG
jgi:hypothetical protein